MSIQLNTVAMVGRSINIRREKAEDDTERTFAHLKIAECFITRAEIDAIAGQRDRWAMESFFDELGAPRGAWTLTLHKVEFTATGRISGPDDAGIPLGNAVLDNIELTFTKLGGLLSGTITWLVAGDEAGDAEPLLGRECRVALVLTDGGQGDLLKAKAA